METPLKGRVHREVELAPAQAGKRIYIAVVCRRGPIKAIPAAARVAAARGYTSAPAANGKKPWGGSRASSAGASACLSLLGEPRRHLLAIMLPAPRRPLSRLSPLCISRPAIEMPRYRKVTLSGFPPTAASPAVLPADLGPPSLPLYFALASLSSRFSFVRFLPRPLWGVSLELLG